MRISDWSSGVCSSDLVLEGERWERHGYAAEADSYWLGFPTGLCTIAFVYAEACKHMSFREFGEAFCSFEPVCTDIFESKIDALISKRLTDMCRPTIILPIGRDSCRQKLCYKW